jgi:hypothetical protein|nr:MAG TPA: hypothetical protein [Caudoviricetes sp.]
MKKGEEGTGKMVLKMVVKNILGVSVDVKTLFFSVNQVVFQL